MSIQKIIVPTDFSDCALNACKYAAKLAKSFNSKIIIVSGYQVPMPAADFSLSIDQDMVEVFEVEAEENFKELKREVICFLLPVIFFADTIQFFSDRFRTLEVIFIF